MKLYGVTIISSEGDILVTKEDGTKEWRESMTKLFLNRQDCIDYAVKQAKISFDAYDFETGETVPEDENGRTWESMLEDLKDGEDICIQACSCHTCFEYFVQELDVYPVVCHYSFDCDVPVKICASEEEAKETLRKDYAEEYRIQTEENEHEELKDSGASIADDGTYAEIRIDDGLGDEPDRIEWSIGRIIE